VFNTTQIKNEEGAKDYPFFWSSTTHIEDLGGVYIAFGRGLGFFSPGRPASGGGAGLTDVHGAGCQRSDPKSGSAADFPKGRGPQGDVVRIYNFVRLVR